MPADRWDCGPRHGVGGIVWAEFDSGPSRLRDGSDAPGPARLPGPPAKDRPSPSPGTAAPQLSE